MRSRIIQNVTTFVTPAGNCFIIISGNMFLLMFTYIYFDAFRLVPVKAKIRDKKYKILKYYVTMLNYKIVYAMLQFCAKAKIYNKIMQYPKNLTLVAYK